MGPLPLEFPSELGTLGVVSQSGGGHQVHWTLPGAVHLKSWLAASTEFWLHGWLCKAGQTDNTVCIPGRRFDHLGLACSTVALPRNVTKEARVRTAARVARGPSPSFLRRMPDAELALSLQLDLSKEVSSNCQVSRGSPEQRHPNHV